MNARRDALTARLGIRHAIIAAPMAGVAGVDLAIAAGRAGALASLPCALLSPAQISEQVAAFRAALSAPINLNFFCHDTPESSDDTAWRETLAPYYAEFGVAPASGGTLRLPFGEEQCALVEALRPEVVSFHFGLPASALLDRVRATGALVLASATTPREARWLAERGVDAVIAQGAEAGGHAAHFIDGAPATHMGLFALLPQIVDAVEVPVIAAGGIGDARGIAAVLLLGASAVQMGTAFLHCPESFPSDMHRAALTSEEATRTAFTTLFSGRAARGIPNRLMRELGPMHPDVPPFPHASTALGPLRSAAEAKGDAGFSPLWAGEAARLGHAESAQALIERLAAEANALLAASATMRV